MSSFPTTPSLSLYTQVRTAITPSTPVLRPAVNTHHPEEARNKAKARATLSPVKTAAVVGVGVVGLMGLHQVWGKVHDFLFGESKPAPPASITPPLAPAVEVPEPPPVPKVNPMKEFKQRAQTGWDNGWERHHEALTEPLCENLKAVKKRILKLPRQTKQGIIKLKSQPLVDSITQVWEATGYDPLSGTFNKGIALDATKALAYFWTCLPRMLGIISEEKMFEILEQLSKKV